ncbi:RING finger protein 37 [Teleopsis dalmanni]|uniref:RING finger protein 37 n=1 Tax=Teleopsis dalmanni TaxID=139649 RepID=UPI0018CD90C1|nr:RING finger protein 37 [Teleopsis dalmanni]
MSLINFLNSKLKPSVECDAICLDGYTAANLIADDVEQLSRGFIAYSITKPPVEMIFGFPKGIDLKVIKLWNTTGSLRSTALEVHGKYQGIWERVAYVRDINKDVDCVMFCYQSEYSSRSNNGNAFQQCNQKVFFFKTAGRILSDCNTIKIIILQTYKCAPVLRKAEIWGLPARSLSKVDKELMKTIWNEVVNPLELKQSVQRSFKSSEQHTCSNLNIPEEFLDTITWEIMIFPTVLPSGKVVDQSTIDKHSEMEAKWGRTPSDPFTGLEFTTHRKAILDIGLKARIDKFLTENSDHFKAVPRSLGSRLRRNQNRHASQFASLCQGDTISMGAYSALLTASNYTNPKSTATSSIVTTDVPIKRIKLTDNVETYRYETPLITSTTTQPSTTTTASSPFSSNHISSIDNAIQNALQKMSRFTQPLSRDSTTCIKCKTSDFSHKIQTCQHLICRRCLVELMKDQLCTCKQSFSTADVERFHKL